jgi:hypothetical protein
MGAVCAVKITYFLKYLLKCRQSVTGLLRVVGSAVEWGSVREKEAVKRPSAVNPGGLELKLVTLVNSGVFFSVDLNGDEIFIYDFCGRRILK